MKNMTNKNGIFAATLISILLLVGSSAYAAVIGFEGVAAPGTVVAAGNNYAESGYNIFNPGAQTDAFVISFTSSVHDFGSDFYTWNSNPANNPVVLTNLGGSNFNLNSLDVGSANRFFASFVITGFVSGGGTVSSNFVGETAFRNVFLGWSNLEKVEFQYIGGDLSGDFPAIDNISVDAVPIPAAAWLFGSALLGLVGLKRRKA